jgi:two-component system, OmpR family, sensor histidine kinase VicK
MDQSITPTKAAFTIDIRWLLVACSLLLITSLSFIIISQYNEIRHETTENAQKDANIAAHALAEFTQHIIQTSDQITLILQERFKNLGKQFDMQGYLQASGVVFKPYTSISLLDSNGSVISSNLAAKNLELNQLESVQYHLNPGSDRTRSFYISRPTKNPVSGKWEIQFTRRVLDKQGKIIAVVMVGIDLRNFHQYYDQTHLNPHDSISLVGEDGIIRTRKSGVETTFNANITNTKLYSNMVREQNGSLTSVSSIDGRTRFYAFRKLANYPMFTVVGIDSEDSSALAKKREKTNLRLLLLASVATVFFTGALIIYINRLQKQQIDQTPANNIEHPALSRANLRISYAHEHLQAIWQNTPDAMLTTDAQYQIETYNPATVALFDIPNLPGQSLQKLVPWLAAPKIGTTNPDLNTQVECIRHDGSRFPAELTINAFYVGSAKKFIAILRNTNERKRAEQTETNFVSAVSDELRAPLKAIRYAINTTLRHHAESLPESIQTMLQVANQNGELLSELINDLLDIHELESHCMQFNFATWPLVSILNKAVTANAAYAKEQAVALNLHSTIPECSLRVDQDRFLQIMHNLLSNACKFSHRNSSVSIQAHVITATRVRIAVIDRGIGISDEFRPRLFEKFAQAQAHVPGSKTGTGLGLAIAKSLAEHMGGEIGFHSVPGQGSTFFIELDSIPVDNQTP